MAIEENRKRSLSGDNSGDYATDKQAVNSRYEAPIISIIDSAQNALSDLDYKKDHLKSITRNFAYVNRSFDERKGLICYFRELQSYFEIVKAKLEIRIDNINLNVSSIEKSKNNYGLQQLPLKNYSTNIIEIRNLSSEIKLTNTLFDKYIKGFSAEESSRIEKVLTKIHASIPLFEENIYNIQKHCGNIQSEMELLSKDLIPLIIRVLEKAINNVSMLSDYYNSQNENSKFVCTLLDNCSSISREINSNLTAIISLSNPGQHNNINNSHKVNSKSDRLNIVELNGTKNNNSLNLNGNAVNVLEDFKSRFHNLSEMLVELSNKVFEINKINYSFLGYRDTEKIADINNLSENINDLQQHILKLKSKQQFLEDEIDKAFNVTEALRDRLNDIDAMENSVEQMMINKIITEDFLNNPEEKIARKAQQLLKVFAENHFDKVSLKKIFESTLEELNSIISGGNGNLVNNSNSLSVFDLMDKIIYSYTNLKTIHNEIVQKCLTNKEFIEETISSSKDALLKVRNIEV
ncbi:MAG: hypothetical protein KGZ97_09820 [Bacteroidetes bacterium]|nr:hypothetical protein [Bacteroidota bacterium]